MYREILSGMEGSQLLVVNIVTCPIGTDCGWPAPVVGSFIQCSLDYKENYHLDYTENKAHSLGVRKTIRLLSGKMCKPVYLYRQAQGFLKRMKKPRVVLYNVELYVHASSKT